MSNDRMPKRDEYLTALFGAGGAGAVPSAYAERYTPLSKRSALWSWFLGLFGALLPPVSILGIRAAVRAHRQGNRFTWVISTLWCVATLMFGCWLWIQVFVGRPA
jgi:hypothetical protein